MHDVEFIILGAGAIGSILGAHLVRAGHSVVMLARDRRAHEIERDGLRIRGLSEFSVPVRVLPAPFRGAHSRVLIVATKAPGTALALEKLRGSDIPVIFSIQNGPQKNSLLLDVFGSGRVLGALADISGEMLPGGEVVFTRNVNVFLGELSGTISARARQISDTINASGVHAEATENILGREWSKFCAWAGMAIISIIKRSPTWEFLKD